MQADFDRGTARLTSCFDWLRGMSGEIHEECGIFAVAGHPQAVGFCYYGLLAFQHRGQESAGIAWRQGSRESPQGWVVSDVFTRERISTMTGDMALGHVRYGTANDSRLENAQPLNVKRCSRCWRITAISSTRAKG